MSDTKLLIRLNCWSLTKGELASVAGAMKASTGGYVNNMGKTGEGSYCIRLHVPPIAGVLLGINPEEFQKALVSDWYLKEYGITNLTIEEG